MFFFHLRAGQFLAEKKLENILLVLRNNEEQVKYLSGVGIYDYSISENKSKENLANRASSK